MSYEVHISPKAEKWIEKTAKTKRELAQRIVKFIKENLAESQNPATLPNAKKLQGYNDNRYRWRLGDYRIIGTIQNDEFKILQIIKIAHRKEAYKD